MNFLKNLYTKMIAIGLLFALIAGFFSSIIYDRFMQRSHLEKKIVIIDVEGNNSLISGIVRLTPNPNISNQVKAISDELYQSMIYTLARYQRDKRVAFCEQLRPALTDNSIFLETNLYPMERQAEMEICLNNVYSLSFARLKKKLLLNTNAEILQNRFRVEDFKNLIEYQDYSESNTTVMIKDNKTALASNSNQLQKQMCKEFEPIFVSIIDGFNQISDKVKEEIKEEYEIFEDISTLPQLFTSLSEAIGLSRQCEVLMEEERVTKIKDARLQKMLELNREKKLADLVKIQSGLTRASKIISEITFDDLFRVETLNIGLQGRERYLTKKNILISFSLLGFLFGVILVFNFRVSK